MANSRREKFIPLFQRVTGLLKSGAVQPSDTPLWYNIYKAFPPEVVPDYNRPEPNKNVVNILYKEDVHRAYFNNQEAARKGSFNLFKLNHNSPGAKFLKQIEIVRASNPNLNDNELNRMALKMLEDSSPKDGKNESEKL